MRNAQRKMKSLVLVMLLAVSVAQDSTTTTTTSTEPASIYYTEPSYTSSNSVESGYKAPTEFPGGRIIKGHKEFLLAKSPYVMREDLFIERDAELRIEPGVEIRFAPMIGITVRGVITAEVSIFFS